MLDDFDVPVSGFLRYDAQRSQNVKQNTNPFRLPSAIDSFGFKEQNKKHLHEERERMRKMTLMQRTDALKPSVPPCITQKTRSNSVISRNRDYLSTSNTSSASQLQFEKHIRTSEFIQQTREVYIMQMVIDKKNDEIQRIGSHMKREEAELIRREQKINQESQNIKLLTTKCEVRLARARKKAEDATSRRVDLIKKVKQVTNSVATMNSEILKNEDLLESYNRYNDFLKSLTPHRYTNMFDYFKDPSVLIEDINDCEMKNLNMIQGYHYYSNHLESGTSVLQNELVDTNNIIEELNESIESCDKDNSNYEIIPENSEETQKQSDEVEGELERLILCVRKTYVNCLRKEFNHNPISMLEEIEAKLHDFQVKLTLVDPNFIKEKQIIKDKERREKQRREKQEQQEIEQAKKMKQTLERATKPIKKRTGRPIVGKSKLVTHQKKDDQLLIKQRLEQQRLDKLLYGSPYE